MMARPMSTRVTLILLDDLAIRLKAYCEESGHKKSPLIARLVKRHLDAEFPTSEMNSGGRNQRTELMGAEHKKPGVRHD